MKLQFSVKTDTGRKRKANEDSYGLLKEQALLIVCDGMGGHAAGGLASSTAVKIIDEIFTNPEQYQTLLDKIEEDLPDKAKRLAAAIRLANRAILNRAKNDPSVKGMGTTVVTALFSSEYVIIAHVGDSRAYRYRDGELTQLTVDHSWVNELIQDGELSEEDAKNFKQKNVITRALGTKLSTKVDVLIESFRKNDIYLLCTDGLVEPIVLDDRIQQIIEKYKDHLEPTIKRLIKEANEIGGGPDNITIGMIRCLSSSSVIPEQKTIVAEENSAVQTLEDRFAVKILAKTQEYKTRGYTWAYFLFAIIGLLIITSVGMVFFFPERLPPSMQEIISYQPDTTMGIVIPIVEKGEIHINARPCEVLVTINNMPPKLTPVYIDSISLGTYLITIEKSFSPKRYISVNLTAEYPILDTLLNYYDILKVMVVTFDNNLLENGAIVNVEQDTLKFNVGDMIDINNKGLYLPVGEYNLSILDKDEILLYGPQKFEVTDLSNNILEIAP